MLNDVHPPPLEPEFTNPKRQPNHGAGHPAQTKAATRPAHSDRAHSLNRTDGGSPGPDLIFPEPEDRGDSFNTTMSAVVVGGVLTVLLVTAYMMLS